MSTFRTILLNEMNKLIMENNGFHYEWADMKYKIEDNKLHYDNNSFEIDLAPYWSEVDIKSIDDEDLIDELSTLCNAIDKKEGVVNG